MEFGINEVFRILKDTVKPNLFKLILLDADYPAREKYEYTITASV